MNRAICGALTLRQLIHPFDFIILGIDIVLLNMQNHRYRVGWLIEANIESLLMHLKMSRLVNEQQYLSLDDIDCTNHSKCCRSHRSAQFRCSFELANDNLALGWRQL